MNHRATLYLTLVVLACLVMLAFQRLAFVRSLRAVLVHATAPVHGAFSHWRRANPPAEEDLEPNVSVIEPAVSTAPVALPLRVQTLLDENQRLRQLLELRRQRWPRAVAAAVVGRDPQRWFQEIVIDKGRRDGISVDDPVVAPTGSSTALVGRVVESAEDFSRLMLVQDSLSAVAASIAGQDREDGVVEGNDRATLTLRYLDRQSAVKIGDEVVTSGLGKRFPSGLSLGVVEDIGLDARQLFLEARLRPALAGRSLHWVLVLVSDAP